MSLFSNIKQQIAQLELLYVRKISFFENTPLSRILGRKISADITIFNADSEHGISFGIEFHTPYFRFPVAVQQSQIGLQTDSSILKPAAFRFFDWQSWAHIDGRINWQGEQTLTIKGTKKTFVTGLSYSVQSIPAGTENLGIRLAEGVQGTVRVLVGEGVYSLGFEPGYWMLEPNQTGYNKVAIVDTELMVLIVSLSEIGSGSPRLYASAVENLYQWVGFKLGGDNKERLLIKLLMYIRDWGPLGMEPLFPGLREILQRLGLEGKEHVIFEFYADNWGMHNNWHGRLLAVKILEVLATKKSLSALNAIFDYVKNRDVEPEELDIICQALRRMSEQSKWLQSAPS